MDKNEILKFFSNLMKGISIHPKCREEIKSLFLGTGFESEFLNLFGRFLIYLKDFKEMATKLSQFKLLKKTKGLYRIKLKTRNFNIRIIYSFINGEAALLLAFSEKSGKNVSDYSKYIEPAQERIKELK